MAAPRRIDREALVAAGVQLAAERGLQALTMRELAARLGVTPMAAYRHVTDRDALVGLVVDEIGSRVRFAAGLDAWDDVLADWARSLRSVLGRYRGAARWLSTAPPAGPASARIVERATDALRRAGFDGDELTAAYAVVATWVLARVDLDERRAQARPAAADTWPTGEPLRFDPDVVFERGLALVLDGLRAAAPAAEASPTPVTDPGTPSRPSRSRTRGGPRSAAPTGRPRR